MNHFTDAIRPFFFWSIVDALIIFPIIALANGVLYPRLFPRQTKNAPVAELPY